MSGFRYSLPVPPALLVGEEESVGAYEAKTHLPRLLDEVEAGKTIVITRHGRPVARLVPTEPATHTGKIVDELLEHRRGRKLGAGLAQLIADGRR